MIACWLPIVLLTCRPNRNGRTANPSSTGIQAATVEKLHIRETIPLDNGTCLQVFSNDGDIKRSLELVKQGKSIETVDLVADFHKWLATRPTGTNEVRYIDTVDRLIPSLGEHVLLPDHSVLGSLNFLRPYSGSPAFAFLARIRFNPLRVSYEANLGTPTCYAIGAIVWIRRIYESKFGTFILNGNDLCLLGSQGALGKPKFHIDGEVKGFVLGRYLLVASQKGVPLDNSGAMYAQTSAESFDLATGKLRVFAKGMTESSGFEVDGRHVSVTWFTFDKNQTVGPFDEATGKPIKKGS